MSRRDGGATWAKTKGRVKAKMRDMAEELLKLYAQRKALPGHAFAADTHWQQEFEDAFPYELTPDQASAIADIKRGGHGLAAGQHGGEPLERHSLLVLALRLIAE